MSVGTSDSLLTSPSSCGCVHGLSLICFQSNMNLNIQQPLNFDYLLSLFIYAKNVTFQSNLSKLSFISALFGMLIDFNFCY